MPPSGMTRTHSRCSSLLRHIVSLLCVTRRADLSALPTAGMRGIPLSCLSDGRRPASLCHPCVRSRKRAAQNSRIWDAWWRAWEEGREEGHPLRGPHPPLFLPPHLRDSLRSRFHCQALGAVSLVRKRRRGARRNERRRLCKSSLERKLQAADDSGQTRRVMSSLSPSFASLLTEILI